MKDSLETLWAPWRMQFIQDPKPDSAECVFCYLPKQPDSNDPANLVLWRGHSVFVVMNRYPYNCGHLLVIPYDHQKNLFDLSDLVLNELMMATTRASQVLKEALNCQGVNVGMNLGKAAVAGIPDHLHMHLVPRWEGDTNFFPILGQTKSLPEYLDETYQKLKKFYS